MNVLLIGLRGSGKSTLGKPLAAQLNMTFIDLDNIALAHFDEPTVTAVWENLGEAAWRDAEASALVPLLNQDGQVIALGGGTPMIPVAQNAIRAAQRKGTTRCVYLLCHAEELTRRLQVDRGDRPSLTGKPTDEEVAIVLAEREPTYQSLANFTIDVSHCTVEEALAQISRGIQ
jgi:shikimate kinase